MKKNSVSLRVTSASMSLDELALELGRAPSSGSHSKGDARADSDRWPETIWRFDSDAHESTAIEGHLENLALRFPAAELKQVLPPDCGVIVDIVGILRHR